MVGDCSGGAERQMRWETRLRMVVVSCHEAGELSCVQRDFILGWAANDVPATGLIAPCRGYEIENV